MARSEERIHVCCFFGFLHTYTDSVDKNSNLQHLASSLIPSIQLLPYLTFWAQTHGFCESHPTGSFLFPRSETHHPHLWANVLAVILLRISAIASFRALSWVQRCGTVTDANNHQATTNSYTSTWGRDRRREIFQHLSKLTSGRFSNPMPWKKPHLHSLKKVRLKGTRQVLPQSINQVCCFHVAQHRSSMRGF